MFALNLGVTCSPGGKDLTLPWRLVVGCGPGSCLSVIFLFAGLSPYSGTLEFWKGRTRDAHGSKDLTLPWWLVAGCGPGSCFASSGRAGTPLRLGTWGGV